MTQPELRVKKERNLGVDLLRCVAMWMIACLHILNRGGVITGSTAQSYNWLLPLNVLVACGVNLYALISGYVTVMGRFHPARVAELWLQVLCSNLVIAVFGEIMQPHIMDEFWIRCLFPLTQKCFWYFTAYVGVYAFSPLINRGLRQLNPRQCRAVLWTMLLLFSVGTFFGYLRQGDPWGIGTGYTVLWLLVLYVIGACIRLSDFGKNTAWWKLLLLAALLLAVAALLRSVIGTGKDVSLFQKNLRGQLLYYVSPTAAGISVCLLILFSRIRVKGAAVKPVRFFAPLTFGIYIIHVHHVNWVWLEKTYRPLGKLAPPLAVLAVLGAGLGLFLACSVLEWGRSLLFRRLRVRQGLDALESRFLGWLQQGPNDTP